MSAQIAIAYIPVLHKGYLDFIHAVQDAGVTDLWLVGDSILECHDELDYLNRKDRLRAVPVHVMRASIEAVTKLTVHILESDTVSTVVAQKILTPREDIGKVIIDQYFTNVEVEYHDVFLRRHKGNIGEDKIPQVDSVTLSEFETNLWADVLHEAEKTADWWRQVGAALVKDGEVVCVTHNEHMPEEQLPNIEGDARALFKKGININYVTSAHAEVAAIGAAAKAGIKTDGAELFVTDFPCPYCARLIVKAGIKKVYFLRGYAVLDGDTFLKEEGIELVQVRLEK